MPLKIVRNDITKMQVDAIVNTANQAPTFAEGVDSAVYRAAGVELLLEERRRIGRMAEGDVAITPGFGLPARFIIHAVSPLYVDGKQGEEVLLRSCYRKSLALAWENQCRSMAFPLISTGSFGYPKEEGMRIALDEINAFLFHNEMLVYLVVFDEISTKLGRNLYPALEAYIDAKYVAEQQRREYGSLRMDEDRSISFCMAAAPNAEEAEPARWKQEKRAGPARSKLFRKKLSAPSMSNSSYDEFCEKKESALELRMRHRSDTFQQYLFYLIEAKGLTNAEVYKRAIITKQLFSKIKLNTEYHPDKATAMRLCVGAGLNLDETRDLLARAGYALSPCDKRDIIFSFFIEQEIYDMIEIDIALEEHGLPCFIE